MKNVPRIRFLIKLSRAKESISIRLYTSITNCKCIDTRRISLEICLRRLVHKNLIDSKVGRGVNVVALDGKTFEVKLIDTFDTYAEGKRHR